MASKGEQKMYHLLNLYDLSLKQVLPVQLLFGIMILSCPLYHIQMVQYSVYLWRNKLQASTIFLYSKILFTLLCGQISHFHLMLWFDISSSIYKTLLDALHQQVGVTTEMPSYDLVGCLVRGRSITANILI